MGVLNPRLFAALKAEFRHVKVSKPGQKMVGYYLPGPDGRLRLHPAESGEQYVLNCPYCADTGGHLYVNHRWGVRDPNNGTRNLWLAHCFRSHCLTKWEHREDLADRLAGYGFHVGAGAVEAAALSEAKPSLAPVRLPQDFRLLPELTKAHAAVTYVRRRGFSTAELSKLWGVGFSADAYREFPGRLVIPLRGRLDDDVDDATYWRNDGTTDPPGSPGAWTVVGYQGRVLGDPEPRQPKYLTSDGTQKSLLLYGSDRVPADAPDPVVVCEGVTDVWRVGPGAVALLGKNISEQQCKLMRRYFPGRDVVVLLDPEARAEAEAVAERLRRVLGCDLLSGKRPGRVAVARLNGDLDPGDRDPDDLRRTIQKALARVRTLGS